MSENTVDKIIESNGAQNENPCSGIDPEFLNDFILDTKEHIEKIEMNALLLETEPHNEEAIHALFREFHTIKGSAGFVEQYLVQEIAHHTETLLDDCRKGNVKANIVIVDLILNSTDFIKKLCDDVELNQDAAFAKLVESHMKSLLNTREDADAAAENNCSRAKRTGEISEAPKNSNDTEYIRIPVQKVDNLVDMMGELIIIQSLVEQEMTKRFGADDKFVSNLLKISRITKDIQNLSMSLRMVSLKSTFRKISRIGRDTITELGKNVSIRLSGEETEIDRGVAEKILDPLIHLVKNCISHGIEDEKERAGKGKPQQGQVTIEAYNKRGSIYIEISDDGDGISIDKVYKKAVEKNLIDPSANYSEDEILNFIFLPGFSTAETVNNISGRGVGLDVVKTEVSKIGGKVEVSSRPGEGCTFVLKIPINLAVMNGTIVDIMGSHYILPTLNIKEIFKPEQNQWVYVKGKKTMIKVREDIVPIIPFHSISPLREERGTGSTDLIVVIELEQKQKALPVSSIVGKQEIVVKSLGYEFSSLDFISGASILGDGRVSLILDVENLLRMEGEN